MRKLLVANRGEIARRVFRTARSMGIATVAVFSDADDGAPHVGEADEAVRLPGSSPSETYLDIDAVIAAALLTGADAIHPGYGFLSESARFAEACAAAGLTFVGPSPAAITAMGSKTAAKELMARAGVPVLPGITVRPGDDVLVAAETTGWPVLVKAAFGGGGRGMRVVRVADELAEAVESARREAGAAFGDDTVFLERFVENPRHIEVQIFGDQEGTVVHLFERECSIQRRYQKVIEEAPSPVVDDDLRAELCGAAVAAAKALDYVGAGTVEFVLAQDGSFFFLEVNTRLQVEHPVTELVTGLDLVELQLRVARGEPLPATAVNARLNGHAIEARLYAEDVAAGFVPASGRIDRLSVPELEGVRVDSGYVDGSVVSVHYDAMLAKVISWAPSRDEATGRLAAALTASEIHGPPTNRDLLVRVLHHADFAAGLTDTGFLERHDCSAPLAGDIDRRVHAVAAAMARRSERQLGTTLPAGWRNVWTGFQRAEFDVAVVDYRSARDRLEVRVDDDDLDVHVWAASPDIVDVTVGGVRRLVRVHRVGSTVYVDDASGSTRLREVDRLPPPDRMAAAGSLLAPMPGTVVRVIGEIGAHVEAGDAVVVIEAMKMEHRISSPTAGVISSFHVAMGDQVDTGMVLATVDEVESEHDENADGGDGR